MKILLDENLPRKLKPDFGFEFEVKTVRDMGWLGKRNGELLGLIVLNGFDVFITVDQNLVHQQNLCDFNLTIFILAAHNNRRETLQMHIEQIREKLISRNYKKLNVITSH